MSSLGLLAFGAVVGVFSGVLGIGGGIVLVPGLMLLFGFSQLEAQGTSLAVMIPPIGIFGALVYYEAGYIRLPVIALIALGFAVGALVGARLVTHLPVETLRTIFGVLLLYVGLTFLLKLSPAHPLVAIPAALASIAAILFSRITGRRRHVVQSPPGHWEYYI